VLVGDQSGIENNLWGGNTMQNMERNGIVHGAVLAGLERAASLEAKDPKFRGAADLLQKARALGRPIQASDKDLVDMAHQAGVTVKAFEQSDKVLVRPPQDGSFQHFKDGVHLPRELVEDVTLGINNPRLARHVLAGKEGLTCGYKNFVGLIDPHERMSVLHASGATPEQFTEKIVELQELSRGSIPWKTFGDFRRAQKSVLGPDGDLKTLNRKLFGADSTASEPGVVGVFSDDLTADAVGNALMAESYKKIGPRSVLNGGAAVDELVSAKSWMPGGQSAMDVGLVQAAKRYGHFRDGFHIDLAGSGLPPERVQALAGLLGPDVARVQ